MTTLNMSRSASFYETRHRPGHGLSRLATRTCWAWCTCSRSARASASSTSPRTQLSDGTCFHQYQPLTKKGNADIGGGFNDDPLWLPLAVYAYISETGDTSILNERCAYADKPDAKTTLMDHLELSMQYTLQEPRPAQLAADRPRRLERLPEPQLLLDHARRELPVRGRHRQGSVAESVMIAGLFCAACDKMAGIYKMIGQNAKAEAAHDRTRPR